MVSHPRRTAPTTGTPRRCRARRGTRLRWIAAIAGMLALAGALGPAEAQCVAPGAPAEPSPPAAATVPSGTVTLSWFASTGSPPISYEVLLDGLNVICTTTGTSCSIDGVIGSHVWRVIASNECGSATGGPWLFNAGSSCAAPSTPANPSPAPGSTVESATATFVWSASTGTSPITYSVFVDDTTTARCTTTATACAVAGLTAGRHSWYVRAANCGGSSGLGGPWALTANPPCEAPAEPAAVSPADAAVGVGTAPLLQWQAPAGGSPPFAYDVFLDDQAVAACTGIASPSCQLGGLPVDAAVRRWRVVARNACGSASSQPRTFATCGQTAVPVAAIAVEPSGTVLIGGVPQAQPYVGQQVTLRGSATNGPIVAWAWSGVGSAGSVHTTQDVTGVWDSAGSKPVRLTASNCAGSSSELLLPVEIHADVRPVVADFTWAPAPGQAGAPITFTAATGFDRGDPTEFAWTFPGGVTRTGATVEHTFACSGVNQVSLVARRGDVASTPTVKTVTTEGAPACCAAPNRAGSPTPTNGATVPGGAITLRWGRPTRGTDPLVYDVVLDGAAVPACTGIGARECTVTVADGAATHFWRVIARSACGATTDVDTPSEWRFKACSAQGAPDATAFSWHPTGQVVVGGVVQQQPYVGQAVTFSYAPTVAPTALSWTDYQKAPAAVYDGVSNPTVVYGSAGDKKMYLRAGNCAGTRSITQYVKVYADQRPVTARFTTAPASPSAFDLVTVSLDTSSSSGDPDEFTVDFGDGAAPETTTATSVQHAYRCGRTYRLSVTARRTRFGSRAVSTPSTADVAVGGQACAPSGFLLVDMPYRATGRDGALEAGEIAVFNPTGDTMSLVVAARDTGSGQLRTGIPLPPLAPKALLRLPDLLALAGLDSARASLWLEKAAPEAAGVPLVNAWSAVDHPSGRRHGQPLPVAAIWPPADHTTTVWIGGLVHNSLNAERGRWGVITRLTFVDPTIASPARDAWGQRKLILRLYAAGTGRLLRTDSLNLESFAGYRSDYLNRIFHLPDAQDLASVVVGVDIPAGVAAIATAAVTDNSSGSTRHVAAR